MYLLVVGHHNLVS